jgi:transposase InsO family protein
VRRRKSAANSLAALKSIRQARPDGAPIYVILDNLSAYEGAKIRSWAARNNVELCFTATYTSWTNPIEAQSAATHLRDRRLEPAEPHGAGQEAAGLLALAHANARYPEVLAAQRRERARIRIRSERQRR